MREALAPGGSIVWTSTTPIAQDCSLPGQPQGPCYGVQPECVERYNSIALEVLGDKPDVVVNDLWSEMNAVCGTNFTSCSLQHYHDVHCTAAAGSSRQSRRRTPSPPCWVRPGVVWRTQASRATSPSDLRFDEACVLRCPNVSPWQTACTDRLLPPFTFFNYCPGTVARK